jgi:hypothetical protein
MRSEADAADNSFNVESDPDWVKCKSFRWVLKSILF